MAGGGVVYDFSASSCIRPQRRDAAFPGPGGDVVSLRWNCERSARFKVELLREFSAMDARQQADGWDWNKRPDSAGHMICTGFEFLGVSHILKAVSKPLGESASIAVQWSDDVSFSVPIIHPDFSGMDTIDDRVDELRARNESAEALINELLADRLAEARVEVLTGMLAMVIGSKNPMKDLWELSYAVGMSYAGETTMAEKAASFGVSKQAFQQGVEAKRAKLDLRQTRTMRNEEAREKMRLRNSRRYK